MSDEKPNKTHVVPVRMSPKLLEKIDEAARRTGLAKADVIRICLAIGCEDLRKVGFDIARVISEAAEGKSEPVTDWPLVEKAPPMVAEKRNGTE